MAEDILGFGDAMDKHTWLMDLLGKNASGVPEHDMKMAWMEAGFAGDLQLASKKVTSPFAGCTLCTRPANPLGWRLGDSNNPKAYVGGTE
jgi:hypothetical protein